VAARAGDGETGRIVDGILVEERSAAGRIRERFEPAMEATLEARGAAEPQAAR
jgi:hypothetical protein